MQDWDLILNYRSDCDVRSTLFTGQVFWSSGVASSIVNLGTEVSSIALKQQTDKEHMRCISYECE